MTGPNDMTTPYGADSPQPRQPHEPPLHRARQPRALDRRSGGRRWLGLAGTGLVVLLTLIAGQAIIRTEPDRNVTVAPFYFKGEPGQPVTAGGVRVTLLGARGAAKAGPAGGPVTDTTGVWVIVLVRLEATTKTTSPAYVALADRRGRTFVATHRFRQPFASNAYDLQPGIPIEGEVAFEIPKDDADGLTLRIGDTYSEIFNGELEPFTDIRVPASGADVSRWRNDPTPAHVAEPKVSG